MQTDDEKKRHWDDIYSTRPAEKLSWAEEDPSPSREWIVESIPDHSSSLIDVGAGISPLVSILLEAGYQYPAVLDISAQALTRAKAALKEREGAVEWIEADVTTFRSYRKFSLWHDRAVFHFLTLPEQRKQYMASVRENLAAEGHLLIATFSPTGPKKCSGLDVAQFDTDQLKSEVGSDFALVKSLSKTHRTPWGANQDFTYCLFKRRSIS